jgi:cobalamin biosynthesis protein CobD/CbiB
MSFNVEDLLREALPPVDPPTRLFDELESSLSTLHQVAQDELEGWELAAMRDPRNWGRPIAAVAVATGAGAGLVALRVRGRYKSRKDESATLLDLAERTLHDIATETRRVLPERPERGDR